MEYLAFDLFKDKNIALYISGHKFPFYGKLCEVSMYCVVLKTSESDRQFFFIRDIQSFFEQKENNKFV